ncbi:hypothetical protein WBJ53_15000 [Spirosoma sp. SC4-14]|uniref:hypothetical protein n=1 Tax=Spirosoma sp. SC4-14 TaxID=3128900 RepID=UPI0030CB1747
MASNITSPHGITFSAKEAEEYIWVPALNVSGLDDHYKVLTDVNSSTQVVYAQTLDKITYRDSGCDPVYDSKPIVRTEKFWNPRPVEAVLKQCYTDLYGSMFERKLGAGTDRPEIKDTDIEKFILDASVPAAARDLVRMVQLAKYGITAGELTGGATEVKNYNQVDGFWVHFIAAVAAGLTPRYIIAENTGATTADQRLAAGRGQEILRNVYDNQDITMMQVDDSLKMFEVTRAIYNNYYSTLESNNALESARVMLLNGTKTLSYRGIPLKIVDVVDQYLAADFKFGAGANTTITNPHRVVLSVKDNLQVSLDTATKNPVAFKSWDEPKDKAWYARMMYMLDTQVALDQYVSLGY